MEVFVPEHVRKRNPQFSKLIDQLEGNCFTDVLTQEESKHWVAHSNWLEEQIVFTTVQDILNGIEQQLASNTIPEEDKKPWQAVHKCFYVMYACRCVSDDKYQSVLGLNPLKVMSLLDDIQSELRVGKKLLSEELEKQLESLCLKLMNCYDGLDLNDKSKVQHARALQLGDIMKNDKSVLRSYENQKRELLIKEMDARSAYCQELSECANVLIKLIAKYCIRLQPQKDQTIVKNALTSCQTFAAKLKSIRMDLKCETYSPTHLKALKKLRCEILEKIQQRELESADVEHQLEMYKSLGSEFEAIANEYGTANSNIEKQLWALNEIKQNLNKVPD
ncbi:uncharacterized protein LOC143463765 [Clavelina lepadiformis]|uniref:uncharacterized protein LOC143463765 n=1 Tax=Clavelina lepadiformis TaxID=159417 RepID=UPI0040438C09